MALYSTIMLQFPALQQPEKLTVAACRRLGCLWEFFAMPVFAVYCGIYKKKSARQRNFWFHFRSDPLFTFVFLSLSLN